MGMKGEPIIGVRPRIVLFRYSTGHKNLFVGGIVAGPGSFDEGFAQIFLEPRHASVMKGDRSEFRPLRLAVLFRFVLSVFRRLLFNVFGRRKQDIGDLIQPRKFARNQDTVNPVDDHRVLDFFLNRDQPIEGVDTDDPHIPSESRTPNLGLQVTGVLSPNDQENRRRTFLDATDID